MTPTFTKTRQPIISTILSLPQIPIPSNDNAPRRKLSTTIYRNNAAPSSHDSPWSLGANSSGTGFGSFHAERASLVAAYGKPCACTLKGKVKSLSTLLAICFSQLVVKNIKTLSMDLRSPIHFNNMFDIRKNLKLLRFTE